jgi:hypothetical protein
MAGNITLFCFSEGLKSIRFEFCTTKNLFVILDFQISCILTLFWPKILFDGTQLQKLPLFCDATSFGN